MTDTMHVLDPPALLIVCGLPYAGKSGISRELASEIEGAVHIDVDQINVERGFGDRGASVPMMEWSTTYQLAYERTDNALASGQTVIFDAVNASRAQRDILRTHARRAGVRSAVVFVATPEETSRDRWQADDHPMDEFMFQRSVDRFEAPKPDERVVVYLAGMSASDLVSGIRQVFGQ